MTTIYTGGCACGAIRYRIAGEPAFMNHCQCRQCQRSSGTGHQSHVGFHAAEVVTTGEPTRYRLRGDGGTLKERAFCPACGAPVWMIFPDMPALFVVPPASLDDPGLFRPHLVSWTAAGYEWDTIAPGLATFERMPPPG